MRFLIILSVLVLASCTKKEAAPAEPTGVEAANTQAPAEAEAPAGEAPAELSADDRAALEAAKKQVAEEAPVTLADWGEPGTLTLLEPGKAPLRKLRHTFKIGDTAQVELEVTADRGHDEEKGAPYPLLGARYLVTLKTKSVSGDGSKANVVLTIDSASPIGQDEDPTAAASFARLEGMQGSYAVDAQGAITDFEMVVPKDPHRQTAGALVALKRLETLLSIPVPAEEVGVGARWRVVEMAFGKKNLKIRTTYEVTKIKGSLVKVTMSLELGSAPELEGEVKWIGAWGAGRGKASFDLTGVAPVKANRNLERTDKYFILGRGAAVTEMTIASKLTAK
jgi:hypothetical protein